MSQLPYEYDSRNHQTAWDNWLRDESSPIPPQSPVQTVKPTAEVTINIHLPKLRLPTIGSRQYKAVLYPVYQTVSRRLLTVSRKRLAATGVIGLVVLASIILTKSHLLSNQQQASVQVGQTNASGATVAAARPTFTPLVPKDKPTLAKSGSAGSAYDSTRGTFSFEDTINGSQITVSEQVIPDKAGPASVTAQKAAQKLKANQTITYNGGTAAIATDSKANSQVAILSSTNILIFVQSPFKHTDDQWIAYLSSLQ